MTLGVQIKIETHFWPQPTGYEHRSWTAWYEEEEPDDFGDVHFGYGSSPERAISDLMIRFPPDEVLP